ncbi:MAG: 30S ribosomal protein S18 [Alphaproteobacteria bacterium]|nr:MAG: 30S ribosomal protein S18 [Alphaproteobacteria bacterium]TAF39972.1 MAG: 30S ribosomal protein S18 [Alphaproteobacteria bacterium]TAF76948.1 MAG: 30S ribosomal protein S18 [Alphaproteobacteria bacterium]
MVYERKQQNSDRPYGGGGDRYEGGRGNGAGQNGASSGGYNQTQRKPFVRKRRTCPLSGEGAPVVDYKDVKLLSRFVSERGKILPARITAVSAKKQRKMARAIKQARNLALMPYVSQ